MKVNFVPPELRRLDTLRSDVLSLSFFSTERPLRGAAGLVDWRLCGRLSRQLQVGRLTGATDEITLVPPRPRLPFDKLLLVGLGAEADFDEDVFARALERTFAALSSMKTHSSVLALPGRSTGRISPQRAMQLFVDLSSSHEDQDVVTLIENVDNQKVMAPMGDQYRKRA